MLSMINRILEWFKSLFWKEEMELTLVGLQDSGKTTFVNVIAVSGGNKKSPILRGTSEKWNMDLGTAALCFRVFPINR